MSLSGILHGRGKCLKPSIVKVDYHGMAGKQTVEVLEKQTESLKIMVQSYSLEDYRQAQQKLLLHRVIDWSLIATSGTTGALYFHFSPRVSRLFRCITSKVQ